MTRRKKDPFADSILDSDSDISSADDNVEGGPSSGLGSHARKRMRRSKEDAIYGIFGDDENAANEAEGGVGRTVRARDVKGRKVDYRAGQAFVPASSSRQPQEDAQDDEEEKNDEKISRGVYEEGEGGEEEERDAEDEFTPASFYSSRQQRGLGSHQAREPREPPPPKSSKAGGRAGIRARAGIGSRTTNDGVNDAEAGPSKRKSGLTSLSMFVSAGASKVSDTKVPPHEVPTLAPASETPAPTNVTETIPAKASSHPTAQPDETIEEALSASGLPTSFSKPPVAPSSAFQRAPHPPSPTSIPATSIKFGSKFDPSAYLASMGWTGGGLGKSGQGIVTPIEVQLRPERAGIAYGGLKEKTQQARDEARRRGQGTPPPASDDEKPTRGKKKEKEKKAWTQPEREKKPRKPKIEHRTYEQILAEIGSAAQPTTGEKIYDASSGELREVTDLASALGRKGVPSAQSVLPELQHNLRLVCDANGQTLAALAREGRQIMDRRRWLVREKEVAERKRKVELVKMERIQQVVVLVKTSEEISARASEEVEERGEAVLDRFTPIVQELGQRFEEEVRELGLDEAVVGAIAPVFRYLWSSSVWNPLKQPHVGATHLKQWLSILRPPLPTTKAKLPVAMTPYESLIWHLWMPSIRSALNNNFKPHHPSSALSLFETWHPLLPTFVFDNIVHQLLLPKLKAGLAAWDARTSTWGLEHVIFPWLPLLGLARLQEVLEEAKRRLRSGLKVVSLEKGPGKGLGQWRKFYSEKEGGRNEWDGLMLSTLVPRLSSYLDRHLKIDPGEQSSEALNAMLGWRSVVGRSTVKRVLIADFFPKWLQVLCEWLKQPQVELGEVAEWYEFWRSFFRSNHLIGDEEDPEDAANIGFCIGLNLINSALDLPLEKRGKLRTPTYALPSRKTSTLSKKPVEKEEEEEEGEKEIATFRSVLIDELAGKDMFLLKTSEVYRVGPTSTAAVWRVSKQPSGGSAGGGGGKGKAVKVYTEDDVVFLHRGEDEWEPVSIGTLVSAVD